MLFVSCSTAAKLRTNTERSKWQFLSRNSVDVHTGKSSLRYLQPTATNIDILSCPPSPSLPPVHPCHCPAAKKYPNLTRRGTCAVHTQNSQRCSERGKQIPQKDTPHTPNAQQMRHKILVQKTYKYRPSSTCAIAGMCLPPPPSRSTNVGAARVRLTSHIIL